MRKEVLRKFGRTVKEEGEPKLSSALNPFKDHFREDIAKIPVEKRIRYWKITRGDRVYSPNPLLI
jgi:hypothetical protein